ncbi:serine/threonine-protein kinase [Gordonia aurantiaca]|uniref:serine/threonine-protein kinase n=1 Tax=Gordonia sp. B21 TaxID=3151852 RepID=UPI0032674F44
MFEPGTLIAGYRVERLLGSGGMGAVFLARHPELPRYDALKVLKESAGLTDNNFRRRFLREAEVASTLDHPNIVAVHNRGRATVPSSAAGRSDVLWIAMQYVPGTDCARELHATGRFTPARVAHVVSQVARGIDHANRRGLTHRDVKPGNILLAEVDEDTPFDEQRVLLTDFGVAKISDETEALTSVGTVLATLSYASPEQLMGRTLDGRSDQYSLAASAFHLLTGRVPFDDRETGKVIGAHLKQPVPRVSEMASGIPAAADAVIARAMAKTPDERFANCREFADELAAALRADQPASGKAPVDLARTLPGVDRGAGVDAETMSARGHAAAPGRPRRAVPPPPSPPPPPPPPPRVPGALRPPPPTPHPPTPNPPTPHRPTPSAPPSRAPAAWYETRPADMPPRAPGGGSGRSQGTPATPPRPGPYPTPPTPGPSRPPAPQTPAPQTQTPQTQTPQTPAPQTPAPQTPQTGADPSVWQRPPTNLQRQTNDHLRSAGPHGTSESGSNVLPIGLAVAGVVLLIGVVVVFAIAI